MKEVKGIDKEKLILKAIKAAISNVYLEENSRIDMEKVEESVQEIYKKILGLEDRGIHGKI